MLIEPFTTFVVPTIYCGYLELRVRRGLPVGTPTPTAETSLERLASNLYLSPPAFSATAESPVS